MLFKFIFGKEERKSLTIAFLNDLLRDELGREIQELKFEPNENVGSFKDEKKSLLDIECTLDGGERVDIEVQLADEGNFKRRTLYYWSVLYMQSLQQGKDYDSLVPCICINILNFKMFDNTDRVFTRASIREDSSHERLFDELRIQFLELPKFKKKPKTEMTRIERWIALFSDKVSFDEKKEYAMEDPAMNKVLNTYDQFFADPMERRAYMRREIARMDYEQGMKSNFAKGKEEGREETTEELALVCIKEGLPQEKVFQMFKMSSKQISNFLSKYKDILI